MLSPKSTAITFHAFFTKTKTGVAPSSAPTIDIERVGSGSLVVSAGTTTAGLIAGHYTYTLSSGSDGTADDYVAVFKTSDTTVDQQHIPALWIVGAPLAQKVSDTLPASAAAGASGGLPVLPAGLKLAATIASTDVTGNVAADLQTIKTQAVTAAAGVTFPTSIGSSTYAGGAVASVAGAVGSVTGNVGGNVVGSVGSVAAGGIAAASFASGAIDATAFAQAAADKVWSTTARTITGGTVTTYTGNTPQTGDSFARLGAPAGASIAADLATKLATSAYTAPDNADIVTALADLVTLLGRTDPTAALAAVKTVTDKVSTMLAASSANWTYTADAVKNAPGGTAPTVGQIDTQLSGTHGSGAWGGTTGTGNTAVDHNTGGADNLRLTVNGAGIDGADVRAYLASDFAAGHYGASYIKGQTRTGPVSGVAGRMPIPMYLASGNTYTIAFAKPGYLETATASLTI